MRISDWSSDVCSSDLGRRHQDACFMGSRAGVRHGRPVGGFAWPAAQPGWRVRLRPVCAGKRGDRSEEHTSELQSLMRTSYAVFCLKKKTTCYTTNAPFVNNLHPTEAQAIQITQRLQTS